MELQRMTSEDLDCIDGAFSALVVDESCSAGAKSAALRFNARIEQERSRFSGAGATRARAGEVSAELEIELRAAAAMFAVERDRIVRLWRIPLRARAA
jgi:hypothetical protein